MNIKEVAEVRRHVRRDRSNMTAIYGCYINDNKEIISEFRSSTGMTLTEYITQKRLIQASELILRGESFSSAARRAGFPNYSYFYKTFCKHRGTSPKQYFNTQEHT